MQNSNSKILIGGYDLKKYSNSNKVNWYDISSPLFWEIDFHNVTMGNYQIPVSVSSVMADTGTSLNMIPDRDFNIILNTFFTNFECSLLANTLTTCTCTDEQHKSIPDINF